jgi:hypothetical protein
MAKKQIAIEYDIPTIGWVGIIHAPGCENGPYYARVDGYGIVASESGSEDEARVRTGKSIELFLGSRKTELEAQSKDENYGKITLIKLILSGIQSSQTSLGALSQYETKN